MAVVMSMHWPQVSLDQYERVRNDVKWETKVPSGAMFHIAWLADDGFRVIDLWESVEDFQQFNDSRLTPAIARHGLQGQPTVALAPAHAIFAPKVPSPRPSTIRRISRAAKPKARKAKKAAKASGGRAKKAAKRGRKR